MDVDEVEALGRYLQHRSRQLDDIVRQVDRHVNMAMWSGGDHTDFLRMWPTHRARLHAASGRLAELGQRALRNAAEQRAVSGNPGRGRSGWGGPWQRFSYDLSTFAYDAAGLGTFAWGQRALLRTRVSTGSLSGLAEAFRRAPEGRLSRSLTVLSAGLHADEAARHFARGDTAQGAVASGRVLIDVGATANPYVAAFGLGLSIGDGLAEYTPLGDIGDGVYDATLYRRYGTTELTSAQAKEMSRRYLGITGAGRFALDTSVTGVERVGGMVGAAGRSVARTVKGWFD